MDIIVWGIIGAILLGGLAYLFFVGRVDQLIMEIDSLGQQIVSLIACDAWRPAVKETRSTETRRGGSKRKAA